MKFSEQWLREWVDPTIPTDRLAHQLTMAGLEVDAVEPAAPAFDGIVVGRVLSVEPHPDADKLRVCRVDVGQDEPLSIVCGAANVHEGMVAPTATVGAELPGGFKIKKAKLRGVPSHGMLCSAKELGLAESSEGLMPLPADAPVGVSVRDYLGLDDHCIELGLTPNRADCLSVAGIAREVAALNGLPLGGPTIEPVAAVIEDTFPVHLEAAAECPRYVGRVVRGIDPAAATPVWMVERLRRSGIRSLGPVVDVTNYVLLELGQPMHGFDLAKLTGGIHVRKAAEGERLRLLNGNDITLGTDDLVIADQAGPLALAGIMGGEASGVEEGTRDVFLESAFFAPQFLAGRARFYGLHTDSSHRFERGVDPEMQRRALERATALLVAIAGGAPGPVIEVSEPEWLPQRPAVRLRQGRIGRVIGIEFDSDRVSDVLRRLGMSVEPAEDGWQVTAPSFRFDIAIEEDLIEEVARVIGYDQIPTALPVASLEMKSQPEATTAAQRIRDTLVERGFREAITYSFVEPGIQALLEPEQESVVLANPISADLSVMRTTLWAGLLPALQRNINRQQERVRLFEVGLRFRRVAGELVQEPVLAAVAYGPVEPEQWGTPRRSVDFFDLKGDIEAVLSICGCAGRASFEAARHPALHPGQSARILLDGEPIGWLGALHPSLERRVDAAGRVYLCEIAMQPLRQGRLPSFQEMSRFPANRRDLALVVGKEVPAARVLEVAAEAAPEFLKELKLFDVYEGERIDSGRKSLAIGLTWQAQSRTLTDDEVDTAVQGILDALAARLGATLRE